MDVTSHSYQDPLTFQSGKRLRNDLSDSLDLPKAKRVKSEACHLLTLLPDMQNLICKHLSFDELGAFAQTSKRSYSISHTVTFWQDACQEAKLEVVNTCQPMWRKIFVDAVAKKDSRALFLTVQFFIETKNIFSKKRLETTLNDLKIVKSMQKNEMESVISGNELLMVECIKTLTLINLLEQVHICLGFNENSEWTYKDSIHILSDEADNALLPATISAAAKALSLHLEIKHGIGTNNPQQQVEMLQKISENDHIKSWVRSQADQWIAEALIEKCDGQSIDTGVEASSAREYTDLFSIDATSESNWREFWQSA